MKFKFVSIGVDVLDWISIICTFSLLSCICVLKWNALSPTAAWAFQPEILFVATLLLSGICIDRQKKTERILPFIGVALVFAGLAMLLTDSAWSKLLLCMGMGPLLCAGLYRLWQQIPLPAFVVAICCGASAGITLSAIPMILNNYHIWPLLTSGLAVGTISGFLRPGKALHKTCAPRGPSTFNRTNLNILVAVIWGLSSLGTGVSYKWFFLDVPLPAFVHVALLCTGICATGFVLLRLELNRALSFFLGMLVIFNLLQLIAHDDNSFTSAMSYVLFGIYFAGFLFCPLLIWQENATAFRVGLGLSAGFICLIIIPRTLSIIVPPSWLFETKPGWILQTASLILLFFSFCLFTRQPRPAAFAHAPIVQPAGSDTRSPLPDHITRRERDVAILVLQGKTNKEISLHLNIAESTVKTHIGNLLGKTQCGTKSQFIAAYRR